MNKSVGFIFVVALFFSHIVISENQSEVEAEELFESMNMELLLKQSIEQMLQLQIQQNSSLEAYKDVMLQFFAKHMSYESLKPQLIDLYATHFTASELKEINTFYATPTGKKALKKVPELMAQGGQIGAKRVQDNIQELQDMIKAESERIQNAESQ
ncbi:MAG: hypothetical protein ACJAUP_001746 [Cellvibrionaceae bacterium]